MADELRHSGQLADRLVEFVAGTLEELEAAHAPQLELPGVFAGHRVDDSARADLLWVLSMLAEAGVTTINGVDLLGRAVALIEGFQPEEIEGFAAYRVSEAAARMLEVRPGCLGAEQITRAIAAGSSAGVVDAARNGELPTNWLAVALRCLAGIRELGAEAPEADEFVGLLGQVFSASLEASGAPGWLDDSGNQGQQFAAFDIYTPDTYLFAEPLAADLGEPWRRGFTAVLSDLDDIVQPGGAVVWGRSVGALALAMTVELGGAAVRHDLSPHPERWLARADEAFAQLRPWFRGGVVAAHQGRQTMFYRGPARRLQMTVDLLGKLLQAAAGLRRAADSDYSSGRKTWGEVDRLVRFDIDRHAALWTHRSSSLSFALPLMASWSSDYLPSPRSPGLFEPPTSGHPCLLPVLFRGKDTLAPALLPVAVRHRNGVLETEHRGWAPPGGERGEDSSVGGSRRATYEVGPRTLRVNEQLEFEGPTQGARLGITIPELATRPLDVTVDHPQARHQRIDTSGIAEWRSFWSEIPAVHQIELPVAPDLAFTWSVTPQLRVGTTIHGHPYNDLLYEPIRTRLREVPAQYSDDQDLVRRLREIEVLHMAWPEWWSGVDPETTARTIARIQESETLIVWTQHNLLPHFFKDDDGAAAYQLWAGAADAVIHHTQWGKRVALETYDYKDDAVHAVLPHGHWGSRYDHGSPVDREAIEAEIGWPTGVTRLAVVGTPRVEKDLQLVLDAFAMCERTDLHLVIRVAGDEVLPDDPRITVDLGSVPDPLYHRRMHAVDALIMPFRPSGMLTTGTAFDAIGSGTAAITSEWAFFDETFAGADIRYGSTADDLAECLERLTLSDISQSADGMVSLQPRFEWAAIADDTLELLEGLHEN